LVLLPGPPQLAGALGMGMLFGRGVLLGEQGAGGADVNALAAGGAGVHLPPGLIEPGNDAAVAAALGHIPDVGPLNLIADPHAAGAQDAAVVIEAEARMGGIHRALRILIREAAVIHPHRHRHVLQLAVAIGDAEGTDMVAFGKEQLDRHAAEFPQLGRVGADHLAFSGLTGTGRQQPLAALQLHQAQAAGPHRIETIEMAEGGNRQPRRPDRLQQHRSRRHRHIPPIHLQGDDAHGFASTVAVYSWRK
jgi:hypothetical protein